MRSRRGKQAIPLPTPEVGEGGGKENERVLLTFPPGMAGQGKEAAVNLLRIITLAAKSRRAAGLSFSLSC